MSKQRRNYGGAFVTKEKGQWNHGTIRGYTIHKCRCLLCVATYNKYIDKKKIDDGSWEHGTHDGYSNHRCRCQRCKKAYSEYKLEYKKSKGWIRKSPSLKKKRYAPKTKVFVALDIDNHGTSTGYKKGCRCKECSEAHHNYYLEYKTVGRKPVIIPEHGTYARYQQGCRCPECVEVSRASKRKWKLSNPVKKGSNQAIAANLRTRIIHALRGRVKNGSAVRDLGCTLDELRVHLDMQFTEGMSWDNYGWGMDKWNIDHIKPLNTFHLEIREEFLRACHYTNMRPLWQIDNFRRPHSGSDVTLVPLPFIGVRL